MINRPQWSHLLTKPGQSKQSWTSFELRTAHSDTKVTKSLVQLKNKSFYHNMHTLYWMTVWCLIIIGWTELRNCTWHKYDLLNKRPYFNRVLHMKNFVVEYTETKFFHRRDLESLLQYWTTDKHKWTKEFERQNTTVISP